ncbi:cardiolipin synthase (CMP-forming) [Malassezia psittaci]|uniref:Cardiolipin synthase (CMP-forming) n=1 Tax=Malassezia psittaci TaxID=1821823 RepID=A0AAF0JFZ7_9BASI|nr:cardiolipin synthase (CMP-forming) [Malassezia psittaci]
MLCSSVVRPVWGRCMQSKITPYVAKSGSVYILRWNSNEICNSFWGQRSIGTSTRHKIHAPDPVDSFSHSRSKAAEKHVHDQAQQNFDKNRNQQQVDTGKRASANAGVDAGVSTAPSANGNTGIDSDTTTSAKTSSNTDTNTNGSPNDSTPKKSSVQKVAEDLYTLPNVLTATRIAMCPVIGWAVMTERPFWAVGLLSIAAATDLLDGWIARRWKSYTVFGSIADPAADKLLMATMVVSLSASGQMPMWLALVILGRDVYLMLLAFYLRFRSLPKPRTFARYWDPRYPSVHVSPTQLSKYNTFLQLLLVATLTVYPCLPEEYQIHPHVQRTKDVLEWIVAITTVWTGLQYAFTRQSVRYLHVRSKT